ncbi:MAG TPA: hypothetical protein VM686_25855 [Polyangiaceae bacterium]|nr:hypothetical protein [Polyangiaceae bacterium]
MIDAPCSRKGFLAFGLCTLAGSLVGCSEDPGISTRAEGGMTGAGTGGNGGGAAGGSAGASGSAGNLATSGTGGGGSSGTSGSGGSGGNASAGSGGSGGNGGTAGGSGTGGSGGTAGSGTGDLCTTDLVAACSPEVGDGHTHTLVITAAAINAGEDVVLVTAADQTGHSHEVEFTSTDFLILKDGGLVVKDECGQGPHQFVIRCPTPPPAIVPECL